MIVFEPYGHPVRQVATVGTRPVDDPGYRAVTTPTAERGPGRGNLLVCRRQQSLELERELARPRDTRDRLSIRSDAKLYTDGQPSRDRLDDIARSLAPRAPLESTFLSGAPYSYRWLV